jgi:AcrR family transcriptional regulator
LREGGDVGRWIVYPKMKRRVDGRTAKGLRIKEQVEQDILSAYIELIREGSPTPTARETAQRAHLSLRVIFKHFVSLSELRLAAIARIEAQSQGFYAERIPYNQPVERRIQQFIHRQTRMLEMVAPFRRAALMVESIDPLVAAAMTRARHAAVREIERTLEPALKLLSASQARKLVTNLHVVCAWPSWETLRAHHGLPLSEARRLVTQMALSILRDALESRKRTSPRRVNRKRAQAVHAT